MQVHTTLFQPHTTPHTSYTYHTFLNISLGTLSAHLSKLTYTTLL